MLVSRYVVMTYGYSADPRAASSFCWSGTFQIFATGLFCCFDRRFLTGDSIGS